MLERPKPKLKKIYKALGIHSGYNREYIYINIKCLYRDNGIEIRNYSLGVRGLGLLSLLCCGFAARFDSTI